jgi:hypothetical protein
MMKQRATLVGGLCFLLGAISLALAQTAMRPDQFVAAPWTWTGIQTFNAANIYGAHQSVTPVVLVDGATVTPAGNNANSYTLTIVGNSHTLAAPTTPRTGSLNFRFLNSGGATGFTVASFYKFPGGTQPSWSTANGAFDVMSCQVFDVTRAACSAVLDVR